MRVVIAGAGKIGSHLARSLAVHHEVIVIDQNDERGRGLSIRADLQVLRGDVTRMETFQDQDISKADVFIALTDSDETNLLACVLAKDVGVHRLISRISDPSLANTFSRLGVEEVICQEIVAANLVEGFVNKRNMLNRILSSRSGDSMLLPLIVEKGSFAEGKILSDVRIPRSSSVLAVYEGDSFSIPHSDAILSEGQKILCVTTMREEETIRAIFSRKAD